MITPGAFSRLTTGRELPPLVSDEIQWCMRFTPDGSHLISGGSGKVNLWDVRTQKRIHVQATGHGYIKSLAVSNDGSLLAAPGSNGRNLHVFDLGN
jgi:WD40 repeat protein